MVTSTKRHGDGPFLLEDTESEECELLGSEDAKPLSRMAQWRLCWRIGFPTWSHPNTMLVYATILVFVCQAMVTMFYTSVASWVV
ncbi:hypothetical protein KIPB_003435 [Kipferlia bialata]|uniref:Uncharacterized protein n=1 Tax=Kipferlia bialata TaxID=797122 RepID=A0A9K3GH97_9EUKA|nr:hypothetical protein KIPB_003435 [Kipferlia bialata]|eukprot:g3435.t1